MRRQQAGVTLIESVVAISILAAGILGLAALQGRALAMSQSVYYRSVATDLATDLAERIRVYRTPFLVMDGAALEPALAAALPPDFSRCVQNGSGVTCSAQGAGRAAYMLGTESAVAKEMGEWVSALTSQLPNGRYNLQTVAPAGVAVANFFRYTLTITWSDDRTTGADFTYTTVIE